MVLTKEQLYGIKNNKIIVTGPRSTSGDRLWDIHLPKNNATTIAPSKPTITPQSINIIIRTDKKSSDLASYLHATLFSPVKHTLLQAIKRNFLTTWPGLTHDLISKHLHPSTFTELGHIRQERHGLRSTKTTDTTTSKNNNNINTEENIKDDPILNPPTYSTPYTKSNDVIYALISNTDTAYMDLCGRFPFRSSRGNEYILIAFHVDSNAILGRPVKNRQAATLATAWSSIHTELMQCGATINKWVLDNETSYHLQAAMENKNTTFQLVPPHNHRANLAERAIQTFKCHLKSGLASVHPDFPITEWDRLLDQCFLTLNILRPSTVNPNLSAYAYLHGQFDFNSTPLAPPGTKVIIHSKPGNRASWDPNGKVGYYVGRASKHYRCMTCYNPQTRSEIVTDTLVFIPHTIPFPHITTDDFIRQAASDIITLLTHPPPLSHPSLSVGDTTKNGLLQLATILNRNSVDNSTINRQTRIRDRAAALISPPLSPPPINTSSSSSSSSSPPPSLSPPQPSSSSVTPSDQLLLDSFARLARVFDRSKLILQHRSNLHQRRIHRHSPFHTFAPRPVALVNHIYNDQGKRMSLDALLAENPARWSPALSNELGRLTQSNDTNVRCTDAMDFIFFHEVPSTAKVTYANFVMDHRPLKTEPWRTRLVVGGDKLDYDLDPGSPAANLLETKILANSVISDAHRGAKFMTLDLKDHFLASPMDDPEYMRIPVRYIPDDIMQRYKLHEKVHNGYVYVKIKKGMYGLKQAALLAFNFLVENLKPFGYEPIPQTVGLWKHKSRPITFCLCVDDFGVKYFDKADVEHLISALKNFYKLSTDWTGKNYCGLTFDWQYDKGFVDVTMPDYIPAVLTRFNHKRSSTIVHTPYKVAPFVPPTRGQRQYAPTPDTSPALDAKGTTLVQQIVGCLLYYARAIDNTMLVALNTIGSSQAKPTQETLDRCQHLLDYCAWHPNVGIRFHASDMVLNIDSDAAYLVAPKARSRIAGFYQLNSSDISNHHPNGPILIECKTLRNVVCSSAECETAGTFHNAQIGIPIQYMLNQIGHVQPPSPFRMDNSFTTNFIHNNITQKRSKSWDMRYHWLRDKPIRSRYNFYWDKSVHNRADYPTKHHPASHHKAVRSSYVIDVPSPHKIYSLTSQPELQGCVSPATSQPSHFPTQLQVPVSHRRNASSDILTSANNFSQIIRQIISSCSS